MNMRQSLQGCWTLGSGKCALLWQNSHQIHSCTNCNHRAALQTESLLPDEEPESEEDDDDEDAFELLESLESELAADDCRSSDSGSEAASSCGLAAVLEVFGGGARTPVEPVAGVDLFLGPALAFMLMLDLGLALLLDLLFTAGAAELDAAWAASCSSSVTARSAGG